LAVTTTINDTARVPGSRRQTVSTVTMDTEYAAGGEPVTAAELGLTRIDWGLAQLLTGSESETVEVGFASFVKKTDTTAVVELYNYKTQKPIATNKDVSKVKVLVWAMGI
jgi:hypothetical protein